MKAIVTTTYGSPEVAQLGTVPTPKPGPRDILVRVHAASVSTADWRMRAAAFPGIMVIPGRLMFGLFRPKAKVLGTDFAGTVAEVGAEVTTFKTGDRVFGFSGSGGHAEYVRIAEEGPVALIPEGASFEEAAALPFGAQSALVFLRDFAKIRSGDRVLVIGASGAVGLPAVQIARAMGAEVTGVASGARRDLITGLGANFRDYRTEDYLRSGDRWDVIFDAVGGSTYRRAKRALRPGGRYIPINIGIREMAQALWTKYVGTRRVLIGISGDTRANIEELAQLVSRGALKGIVDRVYPMAEIQSAYAHVDSRKKAGAVILSITPEVRAVAAA